MKHESVDKSGALNPVVVKLGAVSFFADVASEMLYPITPIFLTSVLGASMATLGLIEGIAEGLASLLKTYSGAWSDSLARRKPFILVGYLLGAVSKPLIGSSQSWTHVLGARALDRTGKGIRSAPRDALIADSVGPAQRGAAFGWHRGMDTLGAVCGPVLSILLLSQDSENLRALYYWALVPGFISVLIIFSVNEAKQEVRKTEWKNPLKSWVQFDRPFKSYAWAWSIFSVTNSSDVFLLMKAKSCGVTTTGVVYMFCVYNLTYSLSSPYLGRLSDSMNRRVILAAGLFVFALVYLGFGFASETWQFWLLFLTYGIYMGATDGVGKAMAVDLSPPRLKATALGILGTITGICTIIASAVAGFIWDQFGPSYAFVFGATGALVCSMLLIQRPRKVL